MNLCFSFCWLPYPPPIIPTPLPHGLLPVSSEAKHGVVTISHCSQVGRLFLCSYPWFDHHMPSWVLPVTISKCSSAPFLTLGYASTSPVEGFPFSGKGMLFTESIWKPSRPRILKEGDTHLRINSDDLWNKGARVHLLLFFCHLHPGS